MKEFRYELGGRHDYVDDILNIQDIALSLTKFFGDSGLNFVISGCKPNSNGVGYTSGFVFIDGKIRYVESTDSNFVTSIVPLESDGPVIVYYDNSEAPECEIYYAAYSDEEVDDGVDDILSNINGFPDLLSAFFDHYALVKGVKEQSLGGTVSFTNIVSLVNYIIANDNYSVSYVDEANSFTINFKINNSSQYSIKFRQDNGVIEFYKSGSISFTIGDFTGEITLPKINGDSMNVYDEIDSETLKRDGVDFYTRYEENTYKKDTGWLNVVNTSNNSSIQNLFVRQRSNIVYLCGQLPKEYICGGQDIQPNEDDVYRTVEENDGDHFYQYKTKIKLPGQIDLPTVTPGCVLSSDVVDSAIFLSNMELHVGVDNFIYISGDSRYIRLAGDALEINMSYLID